MNRSFVVRWLRRRMPTDLRSALLTRLRDPRVRLRGEVGLAVALAVGLILSIVLLLGVSTPLDPFLNNLAYHPLPASGQVVVIAIDQKSLDEIGPWPWPRTIHAALLGRLAAAPPHVVALDIVFSQPSDEDIGFAAAVQRAGNVQMATGAVEAASFPQQRESFPQFDVLLLPAGDLRGSATIGHRFVVPDADGIVRRVPVAIGTPNQTLFPALGLAAARAYLGAGPIQYDLPHRQVLVGAVRVPVDDFGRMLINFTGGSNGIPTYSYSDVFKGTVPLSSFAGKIVLVGGTAASDPEVYATPVTAGSSSTFNVTLQADLAEMVIQTPPRVLEQQDALDQIAITLFFALVAGLTLPHLRPLSGAALTIIYLLLLLLFAFDAFNRGVVVRVLFPGLALILTFLAIATFRYLSEERRRQFLTNLFRRYVPAESVSTVVDAVDRGELPLSGARRIVTVLYCDMRGFSALSEGLAPEAVLELVNRYLEIMLGEIHAEDGTVNKPMGDALVAIWNAPLDQPDHAARAVRAAVRVRKSLLRFQKSRAEERGMNLGLGLATGWAILGNMSALGKVEYTLIGETVNVAQRISAFAGNYQILADSPTTESLPEAIERRELSPVRIRGRKEPLPIWEVRDTAEEISGLDQDQE